MKRSLPLLTAQKRPGPLVAVLDFERSLSYGSEVPTEDKIVHRFWQAWKRLGRKIGDFQARVLLTVAYFIVVAPFALAVRWTADPLALKAKTGRGWRSRSVVSGDPMAWARRQF